MFVYFFVHVDSGDVALEFAQVTRTSLCWRTYVEFYVIIIEVGFVSEVVRPEDKTTGDFLAGSLNSNGGTPIRGD